MKSIKLVLATAALAVSGAAIAGPSYTYVDLGLTIGDSFVNADGPDGETQGLALRGSFGFADIFHVGGEYGAGDLEGGKPDGADSTNYNIYFGVNPGVTENVDFVARLGYDFQELEFDGGSKDEITGLFLEAGTRAMIGEKFELNAFAILSSGELKEKEDGGDKFDYQEISYRVGGEYYITPAISVGVDTTINGVFGDEANIHARWSFGNN